MRTSKTICFIVKDFNRWVCSAHTGSLSNHMQAPEKRALLLVDTDVNKEVTAIDKTEKVDEAMIEI